MTLQSKVRGSVEDQKRLCRKTRVLLPHCTVFFSPCVFYIKGNFDMYAYGAALEVCIGDAKIGKGVNEMI